MTTAQPLRAIALVCTLKGSPAESSSALIAQQVLDALAQHDVSGESVRLVDYTVLPGVEVDEGDGDQWPQIRTKIMNSDILVFATPTWLGQHSSLAQRALERLDAELSHTDDQGRLLTFGKVAIAAVVGNEDGAHHISGILFQALNDVGFTLAANAVTYWNDEVQGEARDYKDLPQAPDGVTKTTAKVAANAAHLARLLTKAQYPAT